MSGEAARFRGCLACGGSSWRGKAGLRARRNQAGPPRVRYTDGVKLLEVRYLGLVPYDEALALQQALVERRRRGDIPDTLLLLEHPHVITFGVRAHGDRTHVRASPERLAEEGVALVETGRGGDVTYHGPGQLVGYPILDLNPDRRDLHRYVRDLEEVLIRAVARQGVAARRVPGLTGVWVGDEKLAAIGVRLSRWITSHGFALNVNTDLRYFDFIVPCGIPDRGVTSLARLLGRPVPLAEVAEAVAESCAEVFERQLVQAESPIPGP